MKFNLELDYEASDKFVVQVLRDAKKNLLSDLESSAKNYDLEHNKENVKDHVTYLNAINKVLYYFTGVEED